MKQAPVGPAWSVRRLWEKLLARPQPQLPKWWKHHSLPHCEVRDVAWQVASTVYSHVTPEPVVREQGTGPSDGRGLVCEMAVRGVWNPQMQMLFDFKIV